MAGSLRERFEEFESWRRRVSVELAALPETLSQFRDGVENFQRVAKRLAVATESLEQINQLQTGALRALRDQIASAPGGSAVTSALDDLTETLARLNPFWPRN